jgi:DNA-binding MarR family transcriptional regulator
MDTSTISNLLHIAAARIARHVKNMDASEGMSPARMSVLSVLVRDGPLTLGALARIENVRAPTMTNIIHGLEEQSYIVRRPDKFDGRVIRIQVTSKGKRRLKRGLKHRENMMDGLLKNLTSKELETVEKAVHILESSLTKSRH